VLDLQFEFSKNDKDEFTFVTQHQSGKGNEGAEEIGQKIQGRFQLLLSVFALT
jgi:hypothetical protein